MSVLRRLVEIEGLKRAGLISDAQLDEIRNIIFAGTKERADDLMALALPYGKGELSLEQFDGFATR